MSGSIQLQFITLIHNRRDDGNSGGDGSGDDVRLHALLKLECLRMGMGPLESPQTNGCHGDHHSCVQVRPLPEKSFLSD